MAIEVQQLRELRDNSLLSTELGTKMVNITTIPDIFRYVR